MNFIIAGKLKKKRTNKKTFSNNFYFLVLDYLESWLNLMIVSMFILESKQVVDVQNCQPQNDE